MFDAVSMYIPLQVYFSCVRFCFVSLSWLYCLFYTISGTPAFCCIYKCILEWVQEKKNVYGDAATSILPIIPSDYQV